MWDPSLWALGPAVQLMGRLLPVSGMRWLWKGRATVPPSCYKCTRYRCRCEGECCGVPAMQVPCSGRSQVKKIVVVSSRCLLPMTKSFFWSQKWRIAGSGQQPFLRRPLMSRCSGWGQRHVGRVASCARGAGLEEAGVHCASPGEHRWVPEGSSALE